MPLTPMPVTDTRALFRPVATELAGLLRTLTPDDWQRPTIAGSWRVRDVTAHIVDFSMRRLSFHRDGLAPPPPKKPITSERTFVEFINGLNADWIDATQRLSPRLLTDLAEKSTMELAAFFESLPLDAPALFGVSWAGEMTSQGWFDVGREFTELWHHQQQIREAVGAAPLADSRFMHAVIEIAVRGLPHAYRDAQAGEGDTVLVDATGPAGGQWTLQRSADAWTLFAGAPASPTTRVRLTDDATWRLLFNALKGDAARAAAQIEGRADLAEPLLAARSIVV